MLLCAGKDSVVQNWDVCRMLWIRKAWWGTYQGRGNDQALHRLGFIKQLQLLDDVHLSLDVYGSMQPAIV